MIGIAERLKGRSELVVVLILLAMAAVVLWDASKIEAALGSRGPVGPKALPVVIGIMLIGCALVLARDVVRGGHGEAEGGEDIDLSHGSDWRTVSLLVAAFSVNIVLIERAGWVISSALLFWGSVYALGSRHYIRDLVIATALALTTFYAFAIGLGINLPAGILQGIL